MNFKDIIYTVEDGIAVITLNRPDYRNALTPNLVEEWYQAIEAAKRDDEVKVLIVTGAGEGFCAGADFRHGGDLLVHQPDQPLAGQRDLMRRGIHRVPRALVDLDKPYIAAINGAAAGAGMDMASMCDIRIASERARFTMAYLNMGIPPGDGGCYFLPRIVGIAKALELIWTSQIIDAQEALRIGYVSRVVSHDELMPVTLELARRLAQGPTVAIQLAKRLVYRCLDLELNQALELHESAMMLARTTEDSREGPQAFRERRPPRFQGR
ncbi:MAG TPA: enoyl-CoA hydratase [Dehalococcoidia bacterium]|jgi:2-(1,2-epoxy-1,2-dihydrophenyl)acetyl-CoA isomerase|nr:enoyl-CoA hydratase [Dehalococcoidia bacterium]